MPSKLLSRKQVNDQIAVIEAEAFLQSRDPLVKRLGRDFRISLAYSKIELTNSPLYIGSCLPIFARALLPEVSKNSRALNYPDRDTREEALARSKLKNQILPILIEKYEPFPLLQEALLDIQEIVRSSQIPITTVTRNVTTRDVWQLVSEVNKISRSSEGQKKMTIDLTDESGHVIALHQRRARLGQTLEEIESEVARSEKTARLIDERKRYFEYEHANIDGAAKKQEAAVYANKAATEELIAAINNSVSEKLGYPQPEAPSEIRGKA